MKILKLNILSIFFIILIFKQNILAQDLKVYGTYKANNLTITSYSKSWNNNMLKNLYAELLNNSHGEEFNYLSNIYIYPDSPEGVNGLYYDNIILENDKYILGENAYINIYNGERFNTIPKIAYTLSHEYGHHYMIYNLIKNENIYYNNLKESNYVKIRGLEGVPVIYDVNSEDYLYHWDIMEIMADDYVQLLGSSNAKLSYDYKSIDEILKADENLYENPSSFNLKPQLNPYIPLAADITGLYNYMFNLGGFKVKEPNKPKSPKFNNITGSITLNREVTYNISWNNPNKDELIEYTLVMYPDNNPFVPYPLETLTSKEPLNVSFGSYSIKDENGSIKSISEIYEGNYTLKLYMKSSSGLIYTGPIITSDFTKLYQNTLLNNKNVKNGKDKDKDTGKNNNIIEKPSASPDIKPIGPSSSGSLGDLFYINSKK